MFYIYTNVCPIEKYFMLFLYIRPVRLIRPINVIIVNILKYPFLYIRL